ncbi:stage III sporulation protein AC, partial [Dysosmobacter welbionis]
SSPVPAPGRSGIAPSAPPWPWACGPAKGHWCPASRSAGRCPPECQVPRRGAPGRWRPSCPTPIRF